MRCKLWKQRFVFILWYFNTALQAGRREAELGTLCRFFSLGGRLSRIIFMALSGGSLKYGGSPSTISITMMPSDQMSTCARTMWSVPVGAGCGEDVQRKTHSGCSERASGYLWPIRESRYELWGHPVRRSDQRLPPLHLFRHLGAEAKVGQLNLETDREKVQQPNKALFSTLASLRTIKISSTRSLTRSF